MGILSRLWNLTGRERGAPRTVADVGLTLGRLADERRAASAQILALLERRRALLLDAETDAEITAVDAEADALRISVERLDAGEAALLDELRGLRDQARRDAWRALAERYDTSARNFAHSYRDTLLKWQGLIALRDEAQRGGFAAEANSLIVPPYTLQAELLTPFESALDRQRDQREAAAARPAPTPAAAAAAIATAGPAPSKPTAARPAPAPPAGPPTPAADGTVEIIGLKPAPEINGAPRLRVGQTARLPAAVARDVVASGAADYSSGPENAA